MGLLRAAVSALGGTLADQWLDFFTVPSGLKPTAALFPAVRRATDRGRGSNEYSSREVITNGSKILVPEGYGLVLMQDGAITGFAAEPGSYVWDSDSTDSSSVFASGDLGALVRTSWERFKFGGRPASQQRAFFVSLKELTNNRFGTVSEIYWDDAYLRAQVGAMARGTYTLKIADPLVFIKNFVPARFLETDAVFDFTDLYNDAAQQLYSEVVGSLAGALALYVNDPGKGNRIGRIQQDSVGFAASLSEAVERSYGWRSGRGLEIVSATIVAIEYDEASRSLLSTVQRADALSGGRGNANLQASVAAGLESAGARGGEGILGIGIAAGGMGLGGLQQPVQAVPGAGSGAPADAEDPVMKLTRFKQMLDAGLITQSDYDAAKAKVLGL